MESNKEVISVYGNFKDEEEFERKVGEIYDDWNKRVAQEIEEQNKKDLMTKRVYYAEYDYHLNEKGQECCSYLVTSNSEEAKKLDKNYRLATIDEVDEYIALGGIDPMPTIEVKEGIFGWFEHEYIPPLNDEEYICKYVFLQPNTEDNLRDFARCIERIKRENK